MLDRAASVVYVRKFFGSLSADIMMADEDNQVTLIPMVGLPESPW